MKTSLIILSFICTTILCKAQSKDSTSKKTFPLTISVFSESVSLNFKNIFTKPHLGIKLGTEFYYRKRAGSELFQTINIGGYYHKNLCTAGFTNSEFGYRKIFHGAFAEVLTGVGYMLQYSELNRYRNTSPGVFEKTSPITHRFIASVALGAGYTIKQKVSFFIRYEIFGEVPFNYKEIPLLPHETWHVGTRILIK